MVMAISREEAEVMLSSAASFVCLETPSIKTSQRTGEVTLSFPFRKRSARICVFSK